MHVVVCAARPDARSFLHLAADAPGTTVEAVDGLQEFCSTLYRDPASIGVLAAEMPAASVAEMRMAGVRSPLLVLLHDHAVAVVVRVLGAGADDCQPFPIAAEEYLARLAALARRESATETRIDLPAGAVYRPERGAVEHAGGLINLTGCENGVFETLMSRPGTVFTKEMLMQAVYGGRDEPDIKIMDIFVCKLRKKLAPAIGGLDVIETVWGRGFRAVPEGFTPRYLDQRSVRAAG